MAGRNDGDDIFGKFFRNFFSPNMDDHFQELTRQMEDMFQDLGFGDVNLSGGFPHPQAPDGKPPSLENPRDQMLKDPESPQSRLDPSNVGGRQDTNIPRQSFASPFSRFSPFTKPDKDSPLDSNRFGDRDRLSGQPVPTDSFVSSWSSSWNGSSTNNGSGWNKTVVQTVRHPDGTVERIEKTTQNGRTCTTTTTTNPHGETTTNTTCDRPAIGGPPLKDNPDSQSPGHKPMKPYQPNDSGYSKEDIGFFSKLFGFNGFKPKD